MRDPFEMGEPADARIIDARLVEMDTGQVDGSAYDGGEVDSGRIQDAGMADASTGAHGDAGTDAGWDASTVVLDAGEEADSGRPSVDGGPPGSDAGRTVSGGTVCFETGISAVEGDVTIGGGCALTATEGLVIRGSLHGAGRFASLIRVPMGAPGVTLAPGATLQDVRIESSGVYAVGVLAGEGARVENVRIDSERGVGVYVASASAVTLSEIEIVGAVDPLTADDPAWRDVQGSPSDYAECLGCECTPGERDESMDRVCSADGVWRTWTSVVGAYVVSSDVTMEHVTVRNFAGYGMAFDHATVTTTSGTSVWDTVGVGIGLEASDLSVANMYVDSTHDGGALGVGVWVDETSSFVADSAFVGGQAYGVVSLGGMVHMSGGNFGAARELGLWLGPGSDVDLRSMELGSFAGGGIMAVDTAAFRLENVILTMPDLATASEGQGDAVVIIRPPAGTTLQNVHFYDHKRAAILIGADAPAAPRPTYSGDGPGMTIMVGAPLMGSYGALIGQLDVARGVIDLSHPEDWIEWQMGLSRDLTASVADASPPSEIPFSYGTLPSGLSAIIGPSYLAGPSAIVGPMF